MPRLCRPRKCNEIPVRIGPQGTLDSRPTVIHISDLTPDEVADGLDLIDCNADICGHEPPRPGFPGVTCREAVIHSYKSSSDPMAGDECIMCSNLGLLRCGRCRSAIYCSKECQKDDWKNHKPFCTSFNDGHKASDRPSLDHVRIIVTLAGKVAKPVFGWALVIPNNTGAGVESLEYLRSDFPPNMFDENRRVEVTSINQSLGFPHIGHGVHVHWSRADADMDNNYDNMLNPRLNYALLGLGSPGYIRPIQADAIVFAFDSVDGRTMGKMRDVSFHDARRFIDAVQIDRRNPCLPDFKRFIARYDSIVVPALKINNLDEPASLAAGLCSNGLSGGDSVERVPISLDGNDRKNFFYCSRMIQLGLRYLIHVPEEPPDKVLTPPTWEAFRGLIFSQYINAIEDEAASLRQSQLPKTKRAVHVDTRYFRAGSLLIVHASGDACHSEHIDAIFAYQQLLLDRQEAARMGRSLPNITEWLKSPDREHGMKVVYSDMLDNAEYHSSPDSWGSAKHMRMFWNAYKAHFDLDVESPWEMEERTKGRSLFLDDKGQNMLGSCDITMRASLAESARAEALERSRTAGHVNTARQREARARFPAHYNLHGDAWAMAKSMGCTRKNHKSQEDCWFKGLDVCDLNLVFLDKAETPDEDIWYNGRKRPRQNHHKATDGADGNVDNCKKLTTQITYQMRLLGEGPGASTSAPFRPTRNVWEAADQVLELLSDKTIPLGMDTAGNYLPVFVPVPGYTNGKVVEIGWPRHDESKVSFHAWVVEILTLAGGNTDCDRRGHTEEASHQRCEEVC